MASSSHGNYSFGDGGRTAATAIAAATTAIAARTMNSTLSDEIGHFWSWFIQCSKSLRTIRSTEDTGYEELAQKVASINAELSVEVGGDEKSEDMSLIVTAHGKRSLFHIVDALVGRAPKIEGWQIYALKPPLSEDFQIEYAGGVLQLSALWFKASHAALSSEKTRLRIALRDCKDDERKDAALIALETFLGERAFANLVEVEELIELPRDPAANGFFPVSRILDVLARSDRRPQG